MKHHERHHPAPPSTVPAGGVVLLDVTRPDTGATLRATAHALPRPFIRIEEARGEERRLVTVRLAEVGALANALLRAVRCLAGRGVA